MMNKITNIVKKYRIAILSCLGILIVGLLMLFVVLKLFNPTEIKEYKNDMYAFKYDTSWKIKEKKKESIKLIHNKDSEVNIQIVSLEEEYKYSTSDDILDELLFNLEKQNSSYKLLSKEKDLITKYKYDGYKLLYENEESQVLVIMGKKADKVLLVTYEATNEYFDILLDSVQNIVCDFQILDNSFNLTYKLSVDTDDINWSTNDEVKGSNNVSQYEIANKNYLVKYSVPKSFELSSFNSTMSYFNYRGLSNGSITLTANIRNTNIYEYMDKNGSYSTLYYSFKNQREGKNDYSDFKESLQKLDNKDYVSYVYKNSYKSSSQWGDYDYEEVILIYELDSNHILLFEIKATKNKIPKDLIDNIKLNSSKNYASYITKNIIDGYLIGELKEYPNYNKDSIRLVTLKIPTKYVEIDKENNIYESRYYGLDYDADRELYKYDINYDLYTSVESKVKNLSSSYASHKNKGNYSELTYSQDITLNGKTFKVYTGGYTDIGGALFSNYKRTHYYVNSKVLFYEFEDGNCLSIEIRGNDIEVSSEIISELTNFDIENKKNEKGE